MMHLFNSFLVEKLYKQCMDQTTRAESAFNKNVWAKIIFVLNFIQPFIQG